MFRPKSTHESVVTFFAIFSTTPQNEMITCHLTNTVTQCRCPDDKSCLQKSFIEDQPYILKFKKYSSLFFDNLYRPR